MLNFSQILSLANAGYTKQEIAAMEQVQAQAQAQVQGQVQVPVQNPMQGTATGAAVQASTTTAPTSQTGNLLGISPMEQMLLQQQQMLNLLAKNNVLAGTQGQTPPTSTDYLASIINPEGAETNTLKNVFGGDIQ